MKLRSLISLVLGAPLVVLVPPLPARAAADPGPPAIVFPVAGPVTFTDTFDAPRGDVLHEAQDLLGEKLEPIVAAHDGVVKWMDNLEATPGGAYALDIVADSGWSTMYVHINNDTPGTDDGLGGLRWAYAPGIRPGVRVAAGQFIAYMGDSGNAENVAPHLHFEMHRPDGTAFNPYDMLLTAPRVTVNPDAVVNGVSGAVGVSGPATHWEFAEGYTAEGFDTFILVGNPGDVSGSANVSLMLPSGHVVQKTLPLAPHSRATLKLDDLVPADSVATTIDASVPVVAERSMYFHNRGAVDGSASEGVTSSSPHWYLAEGYTGPGFETWLLVANSSSKEVPVRVRFLPGHGPAVDVVRTLPPTSRTTFRVNDWVQGDDVSQVVDTLDGSGVVAERAVYVNEDGGRNGGTAAPGITALSKEWTFAEGSVDAAKQTWLLLANPTSDTVQADVTLLGRSGRAGSTSVALPPLSRRTVDVSAVGGGGRGDVGITVSATGPIVAERSMYFEQGATDTEGVASPSDRWYFAEGYTGGAFSTKFAIANPSPGSASVVLRFDSPSGGATRFTQVQVPGRSRRTLDVRTVELATPEFSTEVTSTAPVVVERTMSFGYAG